MSGKSGTLADPMIRLTLALADYSVRYLAPVILEQIAQEIETCGHPVIPGSGSP